MVTTDTTHFLRWTNGRAAATGPAPASTEEMLLDLGDGRWWVHLAAPARADIVTTIAGRSVRLIGPVQLCTDGTIREAESAGEAGPSANALLAWAAYAYAGRAR